MIPDTYSCGRGKLRKGVTEYTVNIGDRVIVISNVPAWSCDVCSETCVSPDVSDQMDEIIAAFPAGQVELTMNA